MMINEEEMNEEFFIYCILGILILFPLNLFKLNY